jgi:hypothetical protein
VGEANLAAEQEARLAAEAELMSAALEADRQKRMALNRESDKRSSTGSSSSGSGGVGGGGSGTGGGGVGGGTLKRARQVESACAAAAVEDEELEDVESAVEAVEKGCSLGGGGEAPRSSSPSSASLLFAALGLACSASSEALRKRWLLLSKLLHPDRVRRSSKNEGLVARAEEAFKAVAHAYKTLSKEG